MSGDFFADLKMTSSGTYPLLRHWPEMSDKQRHWLGMTTWNKDEWPAPTLS